MRRRLHRDGTGGHNPNEECFKDIGLAHLLGTPEIPEALSLSTVSNALTAHW